MLLLVRMVYHSPHVLVFLSKHQKDFYIVRIATIKVVQYMLQSSGYCKLWYHWSIL